METFIGNIADWFATHPHGLLTGVVWWQAILIVAAIAVAWGWIEGGMRRVSPRPRLADIIGPVPWLTRAEIGRAILTGMVICIPLMIWAAIQ